MVSDGSLELDFEHSDTMSLKNYKKTEAVGSMNGDGYRSFRPQVIPPRLLSPPFESFSALQI